MTLERYWATVLKQWKFIVLCFVVVGLGAFVGSKVTTPVYRSIVLVQISLRSSNSQADINSLLASDQLVQTEAALATSDTVLSEVASHYKGMTLQQLSTKVTSTPRLNTQLFEIDVLDPNTNQAALLANDVANTLIKEQRDIANQDNSRSLQQVQQDLNTTRKQIDSLTSQINNLQTQGGKDAQIALLQSQISGLQSHYTQWQTLLAQLELAAAQSGDFLRVVQPAQATVSPVRPLVLLNTAIGFATGLLLGLVLVGLFELLDTRVRTSDALSELLGLPILAHITRIQTKNKQGEEIINPVGHTYNVESYRILRTNVGFSSVDKSLRTLAVTSALPHEGKSTVAANLAIFMAKAGKSTLLIDADLRRPTVHSKFNLSLDKTGLSNAILACSQQQQPHSGSFISNPGVTNISLEPYMHSVNIPNLRVMPAGPLPPNPPEMLDSKAMEQFIQLVSRCGAEIVIFDTPPLLGLSDTNILAPKVDGTLLVVDITQANKKNVKQVKALLAQAGARVLGCVVNKEMLSRKNGASAYYYYYSQEQSSEAKQDVQTPVNPVMPAFSLPANPNYPRPPSSSLPAPISLPTSVGSQGPQTPFVPTSAASSHKQSGRV